MANMVLIMSKKLYNSRYPVMNLFIQKIYFIIIVTLLLKFLSMELMGCSMYTSGTAFLSCLYQSSRVLTSTGTCLMTSRNMLNSLPRMIVGIGR